MSGPLFLKTPMQALDVRQWYGWTCFGFHLLHWLVFGIAAGKHEESHISAVTSPQGVGVVGFDVEVRLSRKQPAVWDARGKVHIQHPIPMGVVDHAKYWGCSDDTFFRIGQLHNVFGVYRDPRDLAVPGAVRIENQVGTDEPCAVVLDVGVFTGRIRELHHTDAGLRLCEYPSFGREHITPGRSTSSTTFSLRPKRL